MRKLRLYLLLFGCICLGRNYVFAQQIVFQKAYNLAGQNPSIFHNRYSLSALVQDQAGNYYATGQISYNSAPSLVNAMRNFVFKMNKKGEPLWLKAYSIVQPWGNDIKMVHNSAGTEVGFVLATGSSPGYNFLQLQRTDLTGNMIVAKEYGSIGFAEFGNIIVSKLANGNTDGYVATGHSRGAMVLVKTSDMLVTNWSKKVNLENNNVTRGYHIHQTHDQCYLVTGVVGNDNLNNGKLFITKIDASGNLQWTKTYSDEGKVLIGRKIVETSNGQGGYRYLVVGEVGTSFTSTDKDIVVMETDDTGNLQWIKRIDYNAGNDLATGLACLGNEIIINGTHKITANVNSNNSPILIKLDANGNNITLSRRYTNSNNNSDVFVTNDNGFAMLGNMGGAGSTGKFYFIKTNSNGVSTCNEETITPSLTYYTVDVEEISANESPLEETEESLSSWPYVVEETIICKDYCHGIEGVFGAPQTINLCYGSGTSLQASCPGGTVKWFIAGDLNNPVSTTNNFYVQPLVSTQYIARCYNEDDCILSETNYNVIVSPAPESLPAESHTICYGQSHTLPNPPCPGGNGTWLPSTGLTYVNGNVVVTPDVSTTYSYTCRDNNGCIIYDKLYHVEVTPAFGLAIEINACIGDHIDASAYLPFSCSEAAILVIADVTKTLTFTCVSPEGCVSYYYLHINVRPKAIQPVTINVNCGAEINLNDYSYYCGGAMAWYNSSTEIAITDFPGTLPVISPQQQITQNTTFIGISLADPCCIVVLDVIVNPPTTFSYPLCVNGGFDLAGNLSYMLGCDPSNSVWYKNGQPYSHAFIDGPGLFELKCVDVMGCIKAVLAFDITFNEDCGRVYFKCEETAGTIISCEDGETAYCTKDGQPFSTNSDGSVTFNGPGMYVVICLDVNGNIVGRTSYFVYPCTPQLPESGKPAPLSVKATQTKIFSSESLQVFPNPNNGKFNVRITSKESAVEIIITDLLGKVFYNKSVELKDTDIQIESENLNAGIYFVTVKVEGQTLVKKVSIK